MFRRVLRDHDTHSLEGLLTLAEGAGLSCLLSSPPCLRNFSNKVRTHIGLAGIGGRESCSFIQGGNLGSMN